MAIGYLDIHIDLLASFCKALQHGEAIKFFRVVKDGLPHDVSLKAATLMSDQTIRIELESDEITHGQVLSPWLESVRIELKPE